jgi:hypothetical protein
MTLEEFAEETITNWYAMGQKDFPTCLQLAESLGLWNFATELKQMEQENQQNHRDSINDFKDLIYQISNPFNNGY